MEKARRMRISCLLLAAICIPALGEEWKARVVQNLDALVSSCLVVPCSFSHPHEDLPASRLRGVWHLSTSKEAFIYNKDETKVLDSFKGRTRLLGDLGRQNCTLELTDVKNHDNGPFCFRVEVVRTEDDTHTKDKYSFVEDCVSLNLLDEPPKPTLEHPETAAEGHPYTVACVVTHTCPSHRPSLAWRRGTTRADGVIELHREIQPGLWERRSILAFIPEAKDDHSDVTCTAKFNGQKTSSAKIKLYVKREENYNHIIVPAVVGIGTTVIFGVLCVFMVMKYKGRIAALQRQEGSIMNRMSRRFRRPNHVSSQSSTEPKFYKSRFPSPKSQPKSCNPKEDIDDDDYMNTVELNIYGNLKK